MYKNEELGVGLSNLEPRKVLSRTAAFWPYLRTSLKNIKRTYFELERTLLRLILIDFFKMPMADGGQTGDYALG